MFLMLSLFLSLLSLRCYCAEVHEITNSKPLAVGETLVSPGRVFELGFFCFCESSKQYVGLWHKNIYPRKVVWVANRERPLAVSDGLAELEANGLVWQSFDHPGDTMLPTQLLGFDIKSGKRNVMTSWKSENDPSVGRFLVGLSSQTPSQVFVWVNNGSNSAPYWRSGPWDKSRFIGIPEMNPQYRGGFTLDDNEEQGTKYLTWATLFSSTLAYEEISSEGTTKFMVSVKGKNWILSLEASKHPCDIYGACGPFGVCKASESSICKCLKGFVPKCHQDWSKGNWTGGQSHREEKKMILKMVRLKVPDLHEFYTSFGPDTSENCKIRCLNNCSCLAYAFVNSIGCFVWSKNLIDIQEFSSGGVDVFIRIARAELGEGRPIRLIVSLTAICLFSILGAIVFGKTTVEKVKYEMADKIQTSRDTLREYIGKDDPSELLIYDFDSILVATNNFSLANKLGQGGFGPVYKGKLPEGKEIAVK
ncbi:putative non-specific serine/threonine protein kinase [Rosa chinensis]|uniref:Putative non-specific serine/threonine protein kinase n=1 Tax=Rosa chinensis TaxID=74649 RepID=A0A2P6Q3D1_ROSCH|nr:putative non-specific serine/threonine protein kinase [Rosa chinensis]